MAIPIAIGRNLAWLIIIPLCDARVMLDFKNKNPFAFLCVRSLKFPADQRGKIRGSPLIRDQNSEAFLFAASKRLVATGWIGVPDRDCKPLPILLGGGENFFAFLGGLCGLKFPLTDAEKFADPRDFLLFPQARKRSFPLCGLKKGLWRMGGSEFLTGIASPCPFFSVASAVKIPLRFLAVFAVNLF